MESSEQLSKSSVREYNGSRGLFCFGNSLYEESLNDVDDDDLVYLNGRSFKRTKIQACKQRLKQIKKLKSSHQSVLDRFFEEDENDGRNDEEDGEIMDGEFRNDGDDFRNGEDEFRNDEGRFPNDEDGFPNDEDEFLNGDDEKEDGEITDDEFPNDEVSVCSSGLSGDLAKRQLFEQTKFDLNSFQHLELFKRKADHFDIQHIDQADDQHLNKQFRFGDAAGSMVGRFKQLNFIKQDDLFMQRSVPFASSPKQPNNVISKQHVFTPSTNLTNCIFDQPAQPGFKLDFTKAISLKPNGSIAQHPFNEPVVRFNSIDKFSFKEQFNRLQNSTTHLKNGVLKNSFLKNNHSMNDYSNDDYNRRFQSNNVLNGSINHLPASTNYHTSLNRQFVNHNFDYKF